MAEEPGCEPGSDGEDGVQLICPGLMRTGLQSLAEALRTLGYENIVDRSDVFECQDLWIKAMSNAATREDFQRKLRGAQVVIGMPTEVFWEQVLDAFPNAKVILTTRDEAAWYRSLKEAKRQLDTEAPAAPLRSGQVLRLVERWMMPTYSRLCRVLRFSWASALGLSFLGEGDMNEHVTCGMFRKHNMYVQQRVPPERLLVMNVREGWGPLCNFLGLEKPDEAFPEVLDVPYFSLAPRDHKQHKRRHKKPQDSEGAVLQQAIMLELQRGLIAVCAAILILLTIVMIPLLHSTPRSVIVVNSVLAPQLALSIWIAVKYIVRRLPVTVAFSAALKVVFVSIGLNLIFLVYNILKEDLVTVTHLPSIYIVMASRVTACAVGFAGVVATHGRPWKDGRSLLGASVLDFATFSAANELSTWASFEMLKYVSFAVQAMAKSLTVLPNMLISWLRNGDRFPLREWIRALILVVAVVVMQLGDSVAGKGEPPAPAKVAAAPVASGGRSWVPCWELQMGILLTAGFLFFDTYCTHSQGQIFKRFPNMSHIQMMLGGSIFAVLFECLMLTGQLYAHGGLPPVPVPWEYEPMKTLVVKITLVTVTNALGQVLIYYTIKEFGNVVFAWIMTTRKILSVVFSFMWFGHHITPTKMACIGVVFGIILFNQIAKPPSKKPLHHHGSATPTGSSGRSERLQRRSQLAKLKRFSQDNLIWSELSTSATSGESDTADDSPVEECSRRSVLASKLGGIEENCAEGKKDS